VLRASRGAIPGNPAIAWGGALEVFTSKGNFVDYIDFLSQTF